MDRDVDRPSRARGPSERADPRPARPFLRCLGAASAAALAVLGVEALLAVGRPNALVDALPPHGRAILVLRLLASFPLLAVAAALVGLGAARLRVRLGPALAAALPPAFVGAAALGPVAAGHGGSFLALAVASGGLAVLGFATALRAPPAPRPRLVGAALAGATALLLGSSALPLEGGGRRTGAEAGLGGPIDIGEIGERAEGDEGGEAGATPGAGARARNVLVLLADTLRADHLGCYGYPRDTSPWIDAFAREGTLFLEACTPKPKTSPAVASLFTGTWPTTHRVHAARTELLDENVTLAEVLKQAGYATFGVSANANVNNTLGFGQGFDELRWVARADLADGTVEDNDAGRLAAHLVQWLDTHRDQRFFAYAHFIDPHSPYRPPPPYDAMFRGDELDGRLGSAAQAAPRPSYVEAIEESVWLPEAGVDLDAYVARYDGEIRFLDESVGLILAALEGFGLAGSTVVVFLSDHGESVLEHGVWFNHGLVPYEEQVHVPLVLRGPGIAAGQRRAEPVSLAALMPTLLELVGVAAPGTVETRSFAHLLEPGAPEGAPEVVLLSAREEGPSMTQGVRTARWKYLENPGRLAPERACGPLALAWPPARLPATLGRLFDWELERELYDLRADPSEADNLAYREAGVRDALHRRMEALRAASRPLSRAPRVLSSREFSEEAREDLRRLGYLGR